MMGGDSNASVATVQRDDPWDITHSGNNVSLEQELISSGDANRAYRLNTSVAKAFHRMLLASTKV
jgi:flagellar basal-body rod protein FlgB